MNSEKACMGMNLTHDCCCTLYIAQVLYSAMQRSTCRHRNATALGNVMALIMNSALCMCRWESGTCMIPANFVQWLQMFVMVKTEWREQQSKAIDTECHVGQCCQLLLLSCGWVGWGCEGLPSEIQFCWTPAAREDVDMWRCMPLCTQCYGNSCQQETVLLTLLAVESESTQK